MPQVKSFNDSSAISLAYAITGLDKKSDFVAGTRVPMKMIPFTAEGFAMQKESKSSTAIVGNRRTSNSKNTKGSANGSATIEFGATDWVLDILQLCMQNVWKEVTVGTPAQGKFITDSDLKQFMAVEKTVKTGPLAADRQDHEWYFGTMVNDATLKFGDGELMTLAVNTISANADYASALNGADGLGGSMANAKTAPGSYEIADSSNNLGSIELRDSTDALMEVTWSDASLQIQNNVREQSGLGKEFAAGVGLGKVAATFSGEIYYFDQTVLNAHMKNLRVKLKTVISTAEGTYTLQFPNMRAEAPTNNAEGENADYKSSMTLVAEAGLVTIGASIDIPCIMAITFVPTP